MDKQTAERLACLIVAELASDNARAEEIIDREELIENDDDAGLLADALRKVREELLERADGEDDPVLAERFQEARDQLAHADHAELLRLLRGPGLFDEGGTQTRCGAWPGCSAH